MEPEQLLANLRRGVVPYCILAEVSAEEAYGVALAERLVDRGVLASEGTLYPALTRLRKDGLLSSTLQRSSLGPPRRYYRVTPSGVRALEQFASAWKAFAQTVNDLLTQEPR